MSDTWDADDRAIARALDATPDASGGALDAETAADGELVDEYREVLGAMPTPAVTPRTDLEDRVVAAALRRRPATVPTLDRGRARRRNRVRVAALGAATVAAAIVVGLIVHSSGSGSSAPGGRAALATQQRFDVAALLRAPGARTGSFGGGNGRVVMASSGSAAVYDLSGAGPVSIGLVSGGRTTTLGPAPPSGGAVEFTVDHPERVTVVTLIRNGAEFARASLSSS